MSRALLLALALGAGVRLPVCAEQVELVLPDAVTLRQAGLESRAVSTPVSVSFGHARLDPGHTLRIAVTAESPELRILFATTNARGGIGRSGAIGNGL